MLRWWIMTPNYRIYRQICPPIVLIGMPATARRPTILCEFRLRLSGKQSGANSDGRAARNAAMVPHLPIVDCRTRMSASGRKRPF